MVALPDMAAAVLSAALAFLGTGVPGVAGTQRGESSTEKAPHIRMHDSMSDAGMGRMHERMMRTDAQMSRMHQRMMKNDPEMRQMHERMMGSAD